MACGPLGELVPGSTAHSQAPSSGSAVYRPRRPAAALLHKTVRDNLESYLAASQTDGDFSGGVPLHIETAFREYLKCGILTRRMVETAAHMVDHVLPRVPFRQWVLSVPKRVRWHMRKKPEVTSGLLAIFLRAVETTLRQRSPDAPPDARFGAVAFVHRFGSYLNSHIHYHVLVTDGVFSTGSDGRAVFHPAVDLDASDFIAVQQKMRHRGLRWLHRRGHLDSVAIHTMDSPEHAGGWSVDASVHLPAWDRQGLERLVRYCARPPLSQERLGRLNAESLVYNLRKPTLDGRTELILTPLQLLDRLSQLITPPRLHKHRYCGVLAPNAKLRRSVIESAGPAGATLQLLQGAREKMGLQAGGCEDESTPTVEEEPRSKLSRVAARCWALLLVRIYECLPLLCPQCGHPMRIIAFIQDPPVIERILHHIGEPTQLPEVLPARAPPQAEMDFAQGTGLGDWPEMDQTAGGGDDGWD
jgi:hypothetical protein